MENLNKIVDKLTNNDFWNTVLAGLIVLAFLPLIIFIPFLYIIGKLVDIIWPSDKDC